MTAERKLRKDAKLQRPVGLFLSSVKLVSILK